MHTSIHILKGSALEMGAVPSESIDLIVTSPPYPMIEMWDSVFTRQAPHIRTDLEQGRGAEAFAGMHTLLDAAWLECDRVLRPGGIICINIGDATRTLNRDFQLYSNHSRILQHFRSHGYVVLPDILWRKQTNAPNKFLGSGMLPVGAYVTYEHEYILILRKGARRTFQSEAEKSLRRESAFFWEERNIWFSDIWQDIKGTPQELMDKKTRERSGAFPFELAYRLICMFSVKGDRVLDPFAGTGTTLAAALTAARNGIGMEIEARLTELAGQLLQNLPQFAVAFTRKRLERHIAFVEQRTLDKGPPKHRNEPYGFPVMTRQERTLLLNEASGLQAEGDGRYRMTYHPGPGPCPDRNPIRAAEAAFPAGRQKTRKTQGTLPF